MMFASSVRRFRNHSWACRSGASHPSSLHGSFVCRVSVHSGSSKVRKGGWQHCAPQEQVKPFFTPLPPSMTVDTLIDLACKTSDMNVPLKNNYDAIRNSVLNGYTGSNEIGSALTRLSSLKGLVETEELLFLLSTVASCLQVESHDIFSRVQVALAISGLAHLPSNERAVQDFLHALKPKIMFNAEHGDLISPTEVITLLTLYRKQQRSWAGDKIKHILVSSLDVYRRSSSIMNIPCSVVEMNGTDMSLLLFNLQDISKKLRPRDLQLLLEMISSWLRRCDTTMTPHEWSRALRGLSNLNSRSSEVTNLLFAIAEKMQSIDPPPLVEFLSSTDFHPAHHRKRIDFSPLQLSQAMYGLRFMDAKHPAVMQIIRNITATIQHHMSGVFEGKDVARTLYGLKAMSSQEECVRCLCQVLAEKMSHSNIRVNTLQNIDLTMACRGLQKLSSEREEVRKLVKVLAEACRRRQVCTEASVLNEAPFTGQMVSQALFGLQLMDNRHEEVEMLVHELVRCIKQGRRNDDDYTLRVSKSIGKDSVKASYFSRFPSTDNVNMRELCNALYGMRSMSNITTSNRYRDTHDVIEDIMTSIDMETSHTSRPNDNRESTNSVAKLLQCILDRTSGIRDAVATVKSSQLGENLSASDVKDLMNWLHMEPMHMAHAMFGIQHFGPARSLQHQHQSSVVEVDYTKEVLSLLISTQEGLTASQQESVRELSSFSPAHIENWTPYRLHDCLYGLLCVDFTSNKDAGRLFGYLLDVANSLFQEEQERVTKQQNTFVENAKEATEKYATRSSEAFIKLYQTLLFFEGKGSQVSPSQRALVEDMLPQPLHDRLKQILTLASAAVSFPPLKPRISRPLLSYMNYVEEIICGFDTPSEFNEKKYSYRIGEHSPSRRIKAFYNMYLHGLHADIVLVGYFDPLERDESVVGREEDIALDIQWRTDDTNFLYSNRKSDVQGALAVAGLSSFSEFDSFVNDSSGELVVVNVEIDGSHKNIVGNSCRDAYRDNYLRKKFNINVERINITEPHKLHPVGRLGEIIDFILKQH